MKSPQPDAFMVLNILDAVGLSGIGKKKIGAILDFINHDITDVKTFKTNHTNGLRSRFMKVVVDWKQKSHCKI